MEIILRIESEDVEYRTKKYKTHIVPQIDDIIIIDGDCYKVIKREIDFLEFAFRKELIMDSVTLIIKEEK